MAGTERTERNEHGGRHERRRFITRQQVEDAAAAGRPISVQGRDVVTDEAAQRATDLGVRIEREGPGRTASGWQPRTSSSGGPTPAAHAEPDEDLRRAVRAAVVAELGSEAPGLDLVIDRVVKSRTR